MKYKHFKLALPLFVLLIFVQCSMTKGKESKSIVSAPLQEFFKYTGDGTVVISGHRGAWRNSIYPDNSLEGMQYAVEIVPNIFFEVDPRFTKDSVIVLMHDATIDRTTNAQGKLADYTYAELNDIRLRDYSGNVTDFKIPTLEDAIRWSIGKTVLNLDRKDVPPQVIVDMIKKCNAEHHIMLTVHTGEQARFFYEQLPSVMFSARIRNEKEYEDFSSSGVPWQNMMAYVGQTIDDSNRDLVEKLHAHGVKCMIALSPTHDRLDNYEERAIKYKEEISLKPDVIETDYPIEVWEVVTGLKNK